MEQQLTPAEQAERYKEIRRKFFPQAMPRLHKPAPTVRPVPKPAPAAVIVAQPTPYPDAEPALQSVAEPGEQFIPIPVIQRVVAEFYGLARDDLLGLRRNQKIARPRQIAIWLARNHSKFISWPHLGRQFRRDHSTVLHSIRLIDELRESDERLRDEIEVLTLRLKERSI